MKNGVTLIELLITLSIIAILAALLVANISKAKRSAERALCLQYQKQRQISYFDVEIETRPTCYDCHASVP